MKVEQIYTGCLAQGAYYIQSEGEAVIIDPLREVSPYLKRAEEDCVKIKYIFETHFHADFVSGHLTLAEKTGATIVYGPTAKTSFDALIAEDNQIFEVGKIKIKVLHTPGHTMESSCFLLLDEAGKEQAIFTGDTLFLGDVGRPDLAQKVGSLTVEDLAGFLFDSLRNKIMPLSDELTVYPGHGAGSACGKNMMKETVDSLGNQKKMNYALRADMSKEEFVKELTDGLLPPPGYFPLNVKLNKEGYESIETVLEKGNVAKSPEEFEQVANQGDVLILDVRKPQEFAKAHIPNSIFIGLDGSFAPWVGELIIDVKQAILLVAPAGREEEAITRLSRIGFDNSIGFLAGGISAWQNSGREIATIESVPSSELEANYEANKEKIFDVRKIGEFQSKHIENAHSVPLSELNKHLEAFPKEGKFYIHCAGGYRSIIASSILKSRGIHNMIDVQKGFSAIRETKLPLTEFVCPSTL